MSQGAFGEEAIDSVEAYGIDVDDDDDDDDGDDDWDD